ncbi:TLC domain-containing protein [Biscogniauxia sp. FL1348]|nr:TLC domain-containing protein [Biscogniauxia sp. FL1348]
MAEPGFSSPLAHSGTQFPSRAAKEHQMRLRKPSTTDPSRKSATRRKKPRSPFRRFRRFSTRHTWTIPLLLIVICLSLYSLNPTESNIASRFIFLSYGEESLETPRHYGKGPWDIAFVAFYTVVLSFTREFIMQELLSPLAVRCGVTSRNKRLRFMEQAYTATYFVFLAPAGVYVMRRTPVWYFDTRGMYEGFPHRTHEAPVKAYYLLQAAYWTQQALVMALGMERPRKDFRELLAHHVVTVALIALSYRFHFTYMGIAVYLTHDISDLFLAASKSLHYLDSPHVGLYFGVTTAAWIYLRHYLNLRIILSLFTEYRTVGPYGLDWEAEQYKCLLSNVVTFVLLAALQALNIFWLFCLLRNGYRYVVHNIAKDDRSESEGEEEQSRKK